MLNAVITQAGAATTELVAAPGTGKTIVVHGYTFTNASGTATFKSATTALTGAMTAAAIPIHADGFQLLRCASNEALNLVTSGAAAMGHLKYPIENG